MRAHDCSQLNGGVRTPLPGVQLVTSSRPFGPSATHAFSGKATVFTVVSAKAKLKVKPETANGFSGQKVYVSAIGCIMHCSSASHSFKSARWTKLWYAFYWFDLLPCSGKSIMKVCVLKLLQSMRLIENAVN